MITCPNVHKEVIRSHYDLVTFFYRLLWGRHIHHGLWQANESPRTAQLNLTKQLAKEASVAPGQRVLDIGCGMGGSTIYLAKEQQCRTTGVTISPVQQRWARRAAWWQGVAKQADFICADAEAVEFEPGSADLVWSIECTEHLFDKPRFFARAAEWLRPGGRMAICAWLAGSELDSEAKVQSVYDVCEGFFCPSLGSSGDYQQWMTDAGLELVAVHDWTERVIRTWEICRDRVRRTGMRTLARLIDRDSVMFLDRFETILEAYRSGAMSYGCFVAQRAN